MSVSSKQKIPLLRFKEFSDTWNYDVLRNAAKFWNGKAHERDIDDKGKFAVVNSKFVSTNGKTKKCSNSQISPLHKGDVTIVMSDIPNGKALAKCYLIEKDDLYTLNQRIGGVRSDGIISSFLYRILNRNKYFLKFNNGVSQTNLKKEEVLGCPVIYPSREEQKKICSFIQTAESWTQNLIFQKQKLEEYKKGVASTIFSREFRFKDNNGNVFPEWQTPPSTSKCNTLVK